MKNKFLFMFAVSMALLFVSGCSMKEFFNVSDSMQAPINSYQQKDILECVGDYFGSDIKPIYSLYKGKYMSCVVTNFEDTNLNGENYALFFCKKDVDSNELHVLFLRKTENKWEVFKDIKRSATDLEKVYIQDVDNDGNNEFAFVFKGFDEKRGNVYTYRYENGDINKINISNKFFNNFKDGCN